MTGMTRKRKPPHIEPSGHTCYWAGCRKPGDYKAPKPGGAARDYQWFCEEHIVSFNKSWDFFSGMSEAEIYAFQKDSYLGHHPTWKVGDHTANLHGRMNDAFGKLFGESYGSTVINSILPREIRDALSVLDLDHPTDKATIKSQYRDMAKKYHPDVNGNNRNAEEAFKKVTQAYQYLMSNYREA